MTINKGYVFYLVFTVIVVWLLMSVERAVIPTLIAVAETEVARVANEITINVINTHITTLLKDKNLLEFQTNPTGDLMYVRTNTGDLNKIQIEALEILQDSFNNLDGFTVSVPLGQTLSSHLFAPLGPKIRVKLIPYGAVKVRIIDNFDVTGINQTRYNVSLEVTSTIRVVIPLISTKTQVVSEFPLTTVLIPGKVPDTYLTIPDLTQINR